MVTELLLGEGGRGRGTDDAVGDGGAGAEKHTSFQHRVSHSSDDLSERSRGQEAGAGAGAEGRRGGGRTQRQDERGRSEE